jgi:hypothetical protein
MVYSKLLALREHGFTDDQIVQINEFEFTINSKENKVECIEIWKDENRSRDGYQLLTISDELQNHLGGMVKELFEDKL